MSKAIQLLGVPIDILTMTEAVELIIRWTQQQQPKTRQVVTINPELLMRAQTDRDFAEILTQSDLRTADGVGVRWAGEYLITRTQASALRALSQSLVKTVLSPASLRPFPEVVTGADLTRELLRRSASLRLRLFLLGGEAQDIDRLVHQLRLTYHQPAIEGESGGVFSDSGVPEDKTLLHRIRAYAPDIVLVALGAPKQEQFIARYQTELGAKVAIGVGGSLDYLSGRTRRAPTAVRQRGFEWLWRLFWEPWRWQRVLTATVRYMHSIYRFDDLTG